MQFEDGFHDTRDALSDVGSLPDDSFSPGTGSELGQGDGMDIPTGGSADISYSHRIDEFLVSLNTLSLL